MKIYNLVRARHYESNGQKMVSWDRVGAMIIDDDLIRIKLHAMPIGDWDGWLTAFPRDKSSDKKSANSKEAANTVKFSTSNSIADIDEDIPF